MYFVHSSKIFGVNATIVMLIAGLFCPCSKTCNLMKLFQHSLFKLFAETV